MKALSVLWKKTAIFLLILSIVFPFSISGVSATYNNNIRVTGVSLNTDYLNLKVGEKDGQLIATVKPSNATNKGVEWKSSNPTVATVNNGVVHPVAPGNTTITVTTKDGNYQDCANVKVTSNDSSIPVSFILLDPPILNLNVGGPDKSLTPYFYPSNATNQNVSWYSFDPSVATVKAGLVHPVKPGWTIVKVFTEDLKHFAASLVFVCDTKQVPVTSISLVPEHLDLVVGGSNEQLTATINPSNATNQNVKWSTSDPSVATVDENGLVHPVAPGNGVITVTTEDGHLTDSSTVTVTLPVVHVTSISLVPEHLDLVVGGSNEQLTATINPSNATNQNVTWSTSDPSVATVDENGLVHPVTPGNAVITVTTEDGHLTDSSTVTVTLPVVPVTSISLIPEHLDLVVGGLNEQLTATINPSNATNQNVTWSTSDPSVATVDENGLVHPVAPGNAVITVTTEDGHLTDSSTVTVTLPVIPVTSISLVPEHLDLVVGGEEGQLIATINPLNATNQSVTWSSSDPSVATVDENGLVHPVAPGNAVITVTTEDGHLTDSSTVTVISPDKVPPRTKSTMTPIFDKLQHIIGLNVTLTATDNQSGVKDTFYRINSANWKLYTGSFSIMAETTHMLEYYSTDNAGNVESIKFHNFDNGTCSCSNEKGEK
ncbi:Ig-like domain-containing protein [Fictibacillus barbaricus]|uniref:Uncharacterized protein YjdB n=1 Tax=Fictibacillus barbaricus TaxID=182136 RepID=A0ABU1U1I2_9BACL|nr:Ig-like domain-containing protein [Fictibacillus barbaricus]MDR7073345.1 uncharacterized protein YjdB [Fictibacillus barbaricus]